MPRTPVELIRDADGPLAPGDYVVHAVLINSPVMAIRSTYLALDGPAARCEWFTTRGEFQSHEFRIDDLVRARCYPVHSSKVETDPPVLVDARVK